MINSGRAKCEILQDCLRELAFLAAVNEYEIKTVHLDTRSNRLADHLSRWYTNDHHKQQFYLLTNTYNLIEYQVQEDLFEFINDW